MSTSATERVSEVCKTVSTYWAQGREYYQLPSTTYYNNTSCCGGASGELGLGALRVQKLLCRRSRYYWAAFFSQSLQYFLQIILFHSSTYFAASMIIFLWDELQVVCAASSCVAARLTFLALKHSRIAGSVTIALPNTNNSASAGPLDLGARTSLAAAETDATTRLLADTDTP
ncbi:hypothetical protein JR316_0009662 [Psilocybe cubensis]|uniref:Uncharacterized protein n=1 Tax=Psilocybe cubensis TaxID=181762 RepID=A0ACB8GPR0_PSICU|nr:hypothetical protein JR316_0009662 [Psilocybe cubensis]KAH9477449.1 hypothetical protein JR316_0009662 [Psilocybe cubensis]